MVRVRCRYVFEYEEEWPDTVDVEEVKARARFMAGFGFGDVECEVIDNGDD